MRDEREGGREGEIRFMHRTHTHAMCVCVLRTHARTFDIDVYRTHTHNHTHTHVYAHTHIQVTWVCAMSSGWRRSWLLRARLKGPGRHVFVYLLILLMSYIYYYSLIHCVSCIHLTHMPFMMYCVTTQRTHDIIITTQRTYHMIVQRGVAHAVVFCNTLQPHILFLNMPFSS